MEMSIAAGRKFVHTLICNFHFYLYVYVQSKLPYAEVLHKNSYIGRTFIKPSLRSKAVDMKFGVVMSNVLHKRIVLVDDSIVRGNTMPPIVSLLKRAGAKEVSERGKWCFEYRLVIR